MKRIEFSGKVETAYGKVLPTAVPFSGSFEAYENIAEVREAKDELTDDEQIAVRNAERKAKERAVAQNAALEAAGISKPDPNSEEVVRANAIKMTAKLYKVSEEVAAKILEAAGAAAASL